MQSDEVVTILGKAATLSKAVSVCEIVKRKLSDGMLEQQTRIYRQAFNGKEQSCIEIKLHFAGNIDKQQAKASLDAMREAVKEPKIVVLPDARHH